MSCSIVLPRRPSFISIHLVHTYYPTLHTISVFVVSLQCSIHIIMIMSGIRSNVSIVICDPISPGRLCCAIHAFEYTILLKPHFCRVSASNFRSFLFSHFIFIFIYVVYDFPFVFMIFPSQMYVSDFSLNQCDRFNFIAFHIFRYRMVCVAYGK